MFGQEKKHNPAAPKDDDTTPVFPKGLPPLRTFVVRKEGFNETGEPALKERTIHAHGLAVDEERMISFIVFFWLDVNTKTSPAQAMKLVLNSDAWDEVEEINPLFPELETH